MTKLPYSRPLGQVRNIQLKDVIHMQWNRGSASLQGTSHVSSRTPCQDAHEVHILREHLIVAVSDGMGSAKYSHHASQLVVNKVVSHINRQLGRKHLRFVRLNSIVRRFFPIKYDRMLHDACKLARDELVARAQRKQHNLRDYACTLIVAIVTPDGWHVIHIGDGAAVGFRDANTPVTLSRPNNGEYANSTTPLTATDWFKHLRYCHGNEALHALAVFSDGIQNLCINHKTGDAYPGFFVPILNWFKGLPTGAKYDVACQQFLDSPQIRQKSDDDLTLVMAWRR